jgi:hypothetical protein
MKNDTVTKMLRDLRPTEAEQTEDWFSSADEETLLREITTSLRPSSRTRRSRRKRRLLRGWRIVMPAAGACAAAAAAVVVFANSPVGTQTPLGPPPAQAVSFSTTRNGWIIAKVTNPLAAQKTLDADFAAHHLDITLKLIPVGPSLVGTLLSQSYDQQPPNAPERGPIQGLDSHCGAAEVLCEIGVKIWEGFTGRGEIDLGRAAQPGERYVWAPSVFEPGEVLHCSGLVGAPVSDLPSVLQAHGWTVARWYSSNKIVSAPPAGSYISEIFPVTATTVKVNTDPTPAQAVTDSGFSKTTLQQGCPGSSSPLTRPFG